MGSECLVNVTLSCNTITPSRTNILEDNRAKSLIQANCSPYPHTLTTPRISFHYTLIIITLSTSAPYSNSSISMGNAKTTFICKYDMSPLLMTSDEMLSTVNGSADVAGSKWDDGQDDGI